MNTGMTVGYIAHRENLGDGFELQIYYFEQIEKYFIQPVSQNAANTLAFILAECERKGENRGKLEGILQHFAFLFNTTGNVLSGSDLSRNQYFGLFSKIEEGKISQSYIDTILPLLKREFDELGFEIVCQMLSSYGYVVNGTTFEKSVELTSQIDNFIKAFPGLTPIIMYMLADILEDAIFTSFLKKARYIKEQLPNSSEYTALIEHIVDLYNHRDDQNVQDIVLKCFQSSPVLDPYGKYMKM